MGSLWYGPEDIEALGEVRIGGKARGLLRIGAAGLPTPPWYVIPAQEAAGQAWAEDDDVRRRLAALYDALGGPPFDGVAVRSSAEGEDAREHSMAGVFETVFVSSPEAMAPAVDAVLASARASRVDSHLAAAGIEEGPPMAVILQSRVAPECAGVLFSADPRAADPCTCYIEAVFGMGEGLVDGSRTPSRFRVDVLSGRVVEGVAGADGPEALSETLAATLHDALLRLEVEFGGPVDIEWAVSGDRVWVLQARPVTVLHEDASQRPPVCATSWFFDQRFAEPIRPLTRTRLIPMVLRIALRAPLGMLRRPAPDPLMYDYYGQAYVDHQAYRQLFRGVPQWYLSEDLRPLFPAQCCCTVEPEGLPRRLGASVYYFAMAVWAIVIHWGESVCNVSAWGAFQRDLPGRLRDVGRTGTFDEPGWTARWEALERLADRCLRLHRWSLLWADYGYRAFRILLSVLPQRERRRAEDALWAAADLPTERANAALRAVLADGGRASAGFLRRFGHRSGSLDFATPTWGELAASGGLRAVYGFLDMAQRTKASRTGRRGGVVGTLCHPLVRLLEMREEQRFEWERILAAQRRMLLDAGRELTRRGALGDAEEVWFLEWDEFTGALFGGKEVPRGLVAARRHAFHVGSRVPKPAFAGPMARAIEAYAEGEGVLWGIGAGPGEATGQVVVCQGPPAKLGALGPGSILVMVSLDPAWTAVLPQLAGVVLERGGILSHAAILAREYGVPLVAGVQGATSRLRAGQTVTVNGTLGRVTLRETTDHG